MTAAERPAPTRIGSRTFTWGERTFVMGILNVTPDSFSGDGLLGSGGAGDPVAAAVAQARQMVDDGADLLDIGGESTRPGHAEITETEELRRVMPVLQAVRDALPEIPITVDTTKPGVAMAAILKGADAINDIWGVGDSETRIRIAVETGVPIILMHNRAQPVYANVVAEVVDDLRRAVDRAITAGAPAANVIVDPGIGFGKTAEQNLEVLRELGALTALGCPILLGTSRKSTLGKVLDGAPPAERVEATVATTALGVQAGVDIVRVHDVRENVRAARIADAIVRGTWHDPTT